MSFKITSPNGNIGNIDGEKEEKVTDALVYKAIIENVAKNVEKGNDPKTTYQDVSNKVQEYLGLPITSVATKDYLVHWNNELAHSLGRISKDCVNRKLPPITILVENQQEGISGKGFIAYQDELRQSNFEKAWDNLRSSADFKEIIDFIQEIVAISYGLK